MVLLLVASCLVDVFESESDIILIQRHRELLLDLGGGPRYLQTDPTSRISTSQDKLDEVSTFKRVPVM